jgi:lipoprotein-anchoring transpeptidase ErfK/SrfK
MRKSIILALSLATAFVFASFGANAAPKVFWDNAKKQYVTYDSGRLVTVGKKRIPGSNRILRQDVKYTGPYGPNTIVVNTSERRLYYVYAKGKALKYGIGVGREGFTWAGTNIVSRKAEWPGWTPPPEMIIRERAKGRILPAYMEGGIKNPLGARALYIGSTMYRIHGSNEPWTIGRAVSSGCIRMTNEDVTDLYERVRVGTKVVVLR